MKVCLSTSVGLPPRPSSVVSTASKTPLAIKWQAKRFNSTRPVSALPSDIKRYTHDDLANLDISSLPASVQIYLDRTVHTPKRRPTPPTFRKPVIDRLPPLPLIYDYALLMAAIDCRTLESKNRVIKMAQMGDRLLDFYVGYALDQSGVTWSSSSVSTKRIALVSNIALYHLADIYGLPDVALGAPRAGMGLTKIGIWNQATFFEAWIAASFYDADSRGSQARDEWRAAVEWMFRDEVWYQPVGKAARVLVVEGKQALGPSLAFPLSRLRGIARQTKPSGKDDYPAITMLESDPPSDATVFKRPGPSQIASTLSVTTLEGHPPVSKTGKLGLGDPVRFVYERRKIIQFKGHGAPVEVVGEVTTDIPVQVERHVPRPVKLAAPLELRIVIPGILADLWLSSSRVFARLAAHVRSMRKLKTNVVKEVDVKVFPEDIPVLSSGPSTDVPPVKMGRRRATRLGATKIMAAGPTTTTINSQAWVPTRSALLLQRKAKRKRAKAEKGS